MGRPYPPDGPILWFTLLVFTVLPWFYIWGRIFSIFVRRLPEFAIAWGRSTAFSALRLYLAVLRLCFSKRTVWHCPKACPWSFNRIQHHWCPRFYSSVLSSIALALSDTRDTVENMVTWNVNSVTAVMDNFANTHIWTCRSDFIQESLEEVDGSRVMTIGDQECIPVAKGTVLVSWTDSSGVAHSYPLEECLLFPSSQ